MFYFLGVSVFILVIDFGSKALVHGQLAQFGLGSISIFLTIILVGLIALVARRALQYRSVAIFYGMIMGGASGNTLEYVMRGKVEDFIRIGPVLTNVADLAEMVGIFGLIISLLYYGRRKPLRYGDGCDA